MDSIFELQFAVWGTGKYSNILMNQLSEYAPICKHAFHINLLDNVKYFIDNNLDKKTFYGKAIKDFTFFVGDSTDYCIIAVLNKSEICNTLEEHGFRDSINYTSHEKIIDAYKAEILKRKTEIFQCYNLPFLVELDNVNFEELLVSVEKAIESLAKTEEKKDYILQYVIMSLVIERWFTSSEKITDFQLLCQKFEYASVVSAFAWYYGNDITDISEWFCKNVMIRAKSSVERQTIGIVVDKYFGGGIEKVVSLLIPLYVQNGHRVVLITDSYEPEEEFELPPEAIRYTITQSLESCMEKRLKELSECVNQTHIDIMCFHSGYTHMTTFYEMLQLKLQNVAVLMEVHSAFLPIITENKDASKYYPYMYRFVDKLIVLSEVDKLFWGNLGCDCVYIQNPVEDNFCKDKKRDFNRTNTIAWVGRIVQIPKRVLDIIPIMKRVTKVIPDAKLKVIGLPTNPRIYNSLVKLIKENKLEKNIELCGYKSDIDFIYREVDLVLMTSSSESFCNVIMESKIWGIPLVTYELPWLELLKDSGGYTAVKQGDTDAAADAIVDLLNDDERRKQMSIESRKSIEPFINHDVYADWEQVFDDIVDGKSNEVSVCSEFAIIEKMLLNTIYDK